jgi:hypothetical protein
LLALSRDHAVRAQISQMLGDFDLRLAKNFLEMAHAERRVRQQLHDAKPGAIAQTLINLDKMHCVSATSGCARATFFRTSGRLPFERAALSPTASQRHVEVVARRFRLHNRILRNDTAVVFDVHIQGWIRNHALPQCQDLREPIGPQPMVGIVANVCLQNDLLFPSGQAAAIDKIFHDVPDFGDMRVDRNVSSIGQKKSRVEIGMFLQRAP